MPVNDPGESIGEEPDQQSPIQPPRQPPTNQNPPSQPANGNPSQRDEEAKELRGIKAGEKLLFWVGIATILVNLGIWNTYSGQLTQMRVVTEAATRAADSASDSLEFNTSQFDRAQSLTIKQTAASIIASNAAKSAAKTAKDAMYLEERPWVGLEVSVGPMPTLANGVPLIANVADPAAPGSNVVIFAHNTGKTPAVDWSALCCENFERSTSDSDENIPDYATLVEAKRREFLAAQEKMTNAEIAQNPKMESQMRASDKKLIDAQLRTEDSGNIIDSGIIPPNGTKDLSLTAAGGKSHILYYIVGEFVYRDVLDPIKEHITKFCLVRSHISPFKLCGTGQDMK